MEYWTDKEIFASAIEAAKPYTQQEIAEELGVSQPAVSKMLNGEQKMISLAIRWLELTIPLDWEIEKSGDKPVTYYKVIRDRQSN